MTRCLAAATSTTREKAASRTSFSPTDWRGHAKLDHQPVEKAALWSLAIYRYLSVYVLELPAGRKPKNAKRVHTGKRGKRHLAVTSQTAKTVDVRQCVHEIVYVHVYS